jgi:hypothetical protein
MGHLLLELVDCFWAGEEVLGPFRHDAHLFTRSHETR